MAPDVLVLRNAMDSTTRTYIGVVSDPDMDDSDELVALAYDGSQFDQMMPGEHELYEVGQSRATSVTADHLEDPYNA